MSKFYKILHTIKSESIYSHGTVMFLTTTIANIFNLLYHLYIIRVLTPQDYAILNTIIALTMFLNMPSGVLQTALTRYVAHFHGLHNKSAVFKILKAISLQIFGIGTIILFFIYLFSERIAIFFRIPSLGPVYALIGIIAVTLLTPFPYAGLQGLQRFLALGLSAVVASSSRLFLAILFIYLGWGVIGSLNAFSLSILIGLIIALPPLLKALGELNDKGNSPDTVNYCEIYKYLVPVAIASTSFIFLTSVDLILVKHLFSPLEAGHYSIAQMVGKIILFFPSAISIVIFPKVADYNARKENTLNLLKHSLIYVGILSAGAIIICFLFPKFVLKILTGKAYPECIPLVKLFSTAMGMFALLNIFMRYYLSLNKITYIIPFVLALIIETVLIYFLHTSLIAVLIIVNIIAFLLLCYHCYHLIEKFGKLIKDFFPFLLYSKKGILN